MHQAKPQGVGSISRGFQREYFPYLLIGALSIGVFAVSLGGEFIMDEIPGFVESARIRSIRYWPEYFTTGLWDNSSLGIKDQFLYRPLVPLYGSVMYHLFGVQPFMFHVMNVLLHAANSIMVFVLAKAILKSKTPLVPLFSALIFALHPVHTEAVAWIGGGVDVFMTFLFLLSFLSYIRYRSDSRSVFFVASCLLYVFALLYKETAITLPLIIFLYDFTEDRKVFWKRVLIFFFISVVYFIVRISVLGKALGGLKVSIEGIQNVAQLLDLDMKFLFFPWPAGYKFLMPAVDFPAVLASVAFIALLVLAIKRNRKMIFPACWIFIPLIPPLLLAFYSNPVFGDRFLYLPSVGFVIILASLFDELYMRYRKAALIVFCSTLMFYGGATVISSALWLNDKAVYAGAIRNSPKYFGAYAGLAHYYEKKGLPYESLNIYLSAAENIEGKDKAEAYDNIAYIYGTLGYFGKSIAYYEKELEIEPKSPNAFIGLGNDYLSQREYGKAINYYSGALSLSDKNLLAYYNLALAYEGTGNIEKAAFYYRKFIAETPQGKYSENVTHAQRKLQSFPERKP